MYCKITVIFGRYLKIKCADIDNRVLTQLTTCYMCDTHLQELKGTEQ